MKISNTRRRGLLAGSATLALAIAATAAPALAVVPNETTDSEAIVDNDDVFRGVGQFFRADGFVCTGTLINPRTVLFAAHCVNDRPDTDYNTDNVPAVFSFDVDAFPGILNWFQNNFASNPQLATFNINRIFTDPRSLQNPAAGGFIEADIALASLDTPAAGIPTWALLFSTLPAPEAIDPVTGTGYHVNIVGYGSTGNAFDGGIDGVDFRRRAVENMLGGFASLDDRNVVIFGGSAGLLPQNLYQIDFDSQDGQTGFDFNLFRDRALPNEGTTDGGDSGGPLILDAANNALTDEDLVIGVLSGGSRFFGPQPFSSLGTNSFYQPLSLFWQYIVETNPYRYVGAKAGNGNWEDADHWVTLLDPMYRVINADGQIVNGLPTTPELGLNGTEGDFGAVCFEIGAPGDGCTDLATGIFEDTSPTPTPTASGALGAAVSNNRGQVSLDLAGGETAAMPAAVDLASLTAEEIAAIALESSEEQAQADGPAALPAATLANGLPGASDFVPNNIDPIVSADPELDILPRYFDVTLSQTGTTTLSSEVTIDKLTIRGNAGLTVAEAGDLTSLIDINQFGGTTTVNGNLTSVGDFTLFAGMLGGTGTVTAPFLTSVTGVFSPATMGTIGTLTIDGNLVMSSGTTFLADIDGTGGSDRIAVTGLASVGGVVGLGSGISQQVNGQGVQYTILTADGGVSGTFTDTNISAILSQTFIYEENAVLMEIEAASYGSVIDGTDPRQTAYAQLFDQNRPNAALSDLYALDFADADTIRDTFVRLAPASEQAVRSLSAQTINSLQNFNNSRLRQSDRSNAGGKIAVVGAPLNAMQAGLSPFGQPVAANGMALQSGMENTEMTEANLPEDVAIFVAGGLVAGEFDSLPGFAEKTNVTGVYVSAGMEFYPGDNTMVGISGYFNSVEAKAPVGQQVKSDTYAASVYLRHQLANGPVIDGQFSMGSMGFDTTRQILFVGNGQELESSSDDLLVSGALGVSWDLETGIGTFSPGVEGRYATVDLSTIREDGGTLGLAIERQTFKSTQARAGVDFARDSSAIRINATAQYVHEFEDGPQLLAANFAQGIGPNANFVIDQADSDWVEVGVWAHAGQGPIELGVGFDTTIGRDTADAQVFSASATYRF
ncbi:autotransporter domain-containing protein [Erythrobacter sp. NFXS35]|uniref:autotransporter domain-containing protein n=1 Tax=Erythrobacter sp. NFXS35 TaxID=2818436 RepID=UPI0032DFE1F2